MSAVLNDLTIAIPKPVRSVTLACNHGTYVRGSTDCVLLERDADGRCFAGATDMQRAHAYEWSDGVHGAPVRTLVPWRIFGKAESIEAIPEEMREPHHRKEVGFATIKGIRSGYGSDDGRFPCLRGKYGVFRDSHDAEVSWSGLEWTRKAARDRLTPQVELPVRDFWCGELMTGQRRFDEPSVALNLTLLADVVRAVKEVDSRSSLRAGLLQREPGRHDGNPVQFRATGKGVTFTAVVMPLRDDR